MTLAELRRQRGVAFDAFKALAEKPTLTLDETKDYQAREAAVVDLDDQIARLERAQALAAATAQPVAGQERWTVPAAPETDPYLSEEAAVSRGIKTRKGLVIGGMMRMVGRAQQLFTNPREVAIQQYGENHPVTRAVSRALVASIGASGGFIVPPDYVAEIIELLRPKAVVRGSGPRVIPMPRGTMTLPGQASPATASYGTEVARIAASQQALDQIVASYKKLTALVPVGNDLMRYSDPAVDAFVRDDLVKVVALREDLAFLTGDGTAGTPRGFTSFANAWALAQGGTAGNWLSTANSTAAVNGSAGSVLQGLNGGNFITSTLSYTLSTVASELGGAVNKLDSANVPEDKRVWFMNPRSFNYLNNVQNSLGVYV
jgi:HK97 family phage major capsid protein